MVRCVTLEVVILLKADFKQLIWACVQGCCFCKMHCETDDLELLVVSTSKQSSRFLNNNLDELEFQYWGFESSPAPHLVEGMNQHESMLIDGVKLM